MKYIQPERDTRENRVLRGIRNQISRDVEDRVMTRMWAPVTTQLSTLVKTVVREDIREYTDEK